MLRTIAAASPSYTKEAYGVRIYRAECPLCGLQSEYRRGITKSCEHLMGFDYMSENFIFNTDMSPALPSPPENRQLTEAIKSRRIRQIYFGWAVLAILALVVSMILYVLRSLG
jgi:hypothetical protein